MIRIVLLLVLSSIPSFGQSSSAQRSSAGNAQTSGQCSPAVSGAGNTFRIECGIGKAQGAQMIAILNKILSNELDSSAVMAKLDELLKRTNPNQGTVRYDCGGIRTETEPSVGGGISVNFGTGMIENSASIDSMNLLVRQNDFNGLLVKCTSIIDSQPEWLTPRLFCGYAYHHLGRNDDARRMLDEYKAKTGPAYDHPYCNALVNRLASELGTTPR